MPALGLAGCWIGAAERQAGRLLGRVVGAVGVAGDLWLPGPQPASSAACGRAVRPWGVLRGLFGLGLALAFRRVWWWLR